MIVETKRRLQLYNLLASCSKSSWKCTGTAHRKDGCHFSGCTGSHCAKSSETADRAVPTSTSALLQMLLSNFMLRTFEMLGPRERCWPGAQTASQHQVTDNLSSLQAPKKNHTNPEHTPALEETNRPRISGSSFSHSRQAFSAPSALLIGNESTERGPLIANES